MKYLFLAALGGMLLVFPSSSLAKTNGPSCAFSSRSFVNLEKSAQESAEAVRSELEARKELLNAVFDCLEAEVKATRAELDRTSAKEPSMQAVREYLIAGLEDTIRYYENERVNAQNAGLRSAKNIAGNIREWRANTFLPQQARTRAFITWASNKEFLATAGKRLQELDRSVQLLKIVDLDEIQTLLDEASANFRAAQDFHSRATTAFLNGVDSSNATKLSLEALSKTYASFIQLSDTINSLLPHGKKENP